MEGGSGVDDVQAWLLTGDPAVRWQVQRDLTGGDWLGTRELVAQQGWGAVFLRHRSSDGTWPTG